MASQSEQQYAGEIHLEYLRIFSSEGVRVDLSSIVVEINLFEDGLVIEEKVCAIFPFLPIIIL